MDTRWTFLKYFFAWLLSGFGGANVPQQDDAYLFYYFEGYAGERGGLYVAYSYDLKIWHKLGEKLTCPAIGEWQVFRDPCVMRTDDGHFHLVWTTGKSGFGYAHSSDGLTWKDQRFITVTDSARDLSFANVWAPEFHLQNDTAYIIWSSTLSKDYQPPKDSSKWWTSTWNHRFYYTTTTDFKNFEPAQAFWDPGFNAIDAVVYPTDSLYFLFFKDECKSGKNVVMASGKQLLGPYHNVTDVGYRLTEGAIPLNTDTAFVLYYDYYHEYNGYRYITTTDMQHWSEEQLPVKQGFEDVIRHGSIVRVSQRELNRIIRKNR